MKMDYSLSYCFYHVENVRFVMVGINSLIFAFILVKLRSWLEYSLL